MRIWASRIGLGVFLAALMVPLYWMIIMSFKTNRAIQTVFSFWPADPTVAHYMTIFTNEFWWGSFLHSLEYVLLNIAIVMPLALPAAYGFSRYRFLGDKHLFFWLLTNLMAPPAVFVLPFFNLYHTLSMFDTVIAVAICQTLFNLPLAIWILEGFMSGVPTAIDETAFLDGYSLPRFFIQIFVPLIRSGIGVTAFFLFMFSWISLLIPQTLTTTNAKPFASAMTSAISVQGVNWGLLAAIGTLSLIPGAAVIWFVRKHIATGFALGRV
ncbi:carbohydrate ABC transporter permease [Salinisphaera sp. USBA-960]|uniref:carbohydrate ABC transporter permease n=1 Tax=Salinisphaera orenii TaxID=856731 RepID=UPI000DBE3CC2|nr:carbohydrate ABC transporter permease [Salifodinibacter halophilus]NNC26851.1 carbohydrate ABC transporter permease [Salifodinibacter halophilus]